MNLAAMYAQALHEVALQKQNTSAEVIKHFKESLKRRGHEKLMPRIASEYQKLLKRKDKSVSVRIASEKFKTSAKTAAEVFKKTGKEKEEIIVDPSLISGFVVSGPDFRYDASGKRSLIELYKKLIATH